MPRPTEQSIIGVLQRTSGAAATTPKGLDHNPKVEVHLQDLIVLREFALARGDDKPVATLLGFIDLLDRDAVTFVGQDRASVRFSRKTWEDAKKPQSLFFDIRYTPQAAREVANR